MTTERHWMNRALELAKLGTYTVSPNPMVGAVVVRDGQVVGEGFHRRAGGAHAEVEALAQAGSRAVGADLYVTLEPCCVHGRTPPCTDAIRASRLARVIVGATDPNPNVSGRGVATLRDAGVEVVEGIETEQAEWLNRAFNKWITTHTPWVILKLAQTLDGKTAASTGKSQWITSEAMRRHVHELRAAVDAIIVGSGTALSDDPRLNVRNVNPLFSGGDYTSPVKVVLDSTAQLPNTARVFDDGHTIVATSRASQAAVDRLEQHGAEVLSVPNATGRVALEPLLARLGARTPQPVTSVLVEGGSILAAEMVKLNLVDELRLHVAPKLMGADGLSGLQTLGVLHPDQCPQLHIKRTSILGPDIEIVATFR